MTEPGNPALHRMLMDVPVRVEVVLGEVRLAMEELMALEPGEVLTMQKQTNEPVDIYVSGRLIARRSNRRSQAFVQAAQRHWAPP